MTRSEENRRYFERHREEIRARHRAYYAQNREKLVAYARQYRQTHGEELRAKKRATAAQKRPVARKWGWLARYGLTADQAEILLAQQGGGCAICGKVQESNGYHLSVDHCHLTGEVRGFLCRNCNNGLGRFQDDPELLHRAGDYLAANIRGQV